jgi:hypothetical protein
LWKKYFTSSKLVKNIRENHGEPNVIQIRKKFNDKISTRLWEIKVIKRMNIVRDKRFLNQRNPGGLDDFIRKKGSVPWNKGKIGVQKSIFKGVTNRYSDEQLALIKKNTKIAMNNIDPEFKSTYYKNRDSCNNRLWINKDGKHKRIKPEDLNKFLVENWAVGRIMNHDVTGKFITRENYSKET